MLVRVAVLFLEGQLHVPKVSTTLTSAQLDTLCKHIKRNSDKETIETTKASNPAEKALTSGLKKYFALVEKSLRLDIDEI